jgi:DNA-binding PadR family transcriptional regulator
MSTGRSLTTTSYAVLGLLAIKPWTTYELVQQVEFSLRRFWPRAQSKLYEEPKKLVALGLAASSEEAVGKRRRTWYEITPGGRGALAEWLAEPGAGPALEFEQLLKVHFADQATTAAVLDNLAATREWVAAQNAENLAAARAYLDGDGEFPARAGVNLLVGRFLTDFYAMVDDWARWAQETVRDWPDDPARAPLDVEAYREVAALAEALAARGYSGSLSAEPPTT